MPHIDLRNFVVAKSGRWVEEAELSESYRAERLILRRPGDTVTLRGPVQVRLLRVAPGRARGADGECIEARVPSAYSVNVPASSTWSYVVSDDDLAAGDVRADSDAYVVIEPELSAAAGFEMPGHGPSVVYVPYDPVAGLPDDCDPSSPWRPRPRPRPAFRDDLPCDFAVADIPRTAHFFPSACEPCPPGASIGVPPGKPTLAVLPAPGGCVRPRFFNGMFMTSQDMDTLTRWIRMKNQLQNRAAGHGVVWGLGVKRDGNRIMVQTGYGVDCCGHDLTVNTPYCVEIDRLLLDPEAAPILARPGVQCLHLLLEYLECPEEPRPVHGDPCSPDVDRCEMSRIRETVRLRLVPPRHYQPDGPIQTFLDEVKAVAGMSPQPASVPAVGTQPAPAANPYVVEVTGFMESQPGGSPLLLRPPVAGSGEQAKTTILGAATGVIDLALRSDNSWTFSPASVTDASGNVVSSQPTTDGTGLSWKCPINLFVAPGGGLQKVTFTIANLEVARSSDGARFVGTSTIDLELEAPVGTSDSVAMLVARARVYEVVVTVHPVQLRAVAPPPSTRPCFEDPCCPDTALFPVSPPWLHQDPLHPSQAADYKVLITALVHAWLVLELARREQGSDAQAQQGMQSASLFYRAALQVLFGADSAEDKRRIATALHRLFCDWCLGLLYPGPQCTYEPDGVVIGCVTVDNGEVTKVDPWGGRRYVVHYPLLEHWGAQFGIAPLDLTVVRFASLLCCIANQALPWLDRDPGALGRVAHVAVGNGIMVFPQDGDGSEAEQPEVEVARRIETSSPVDFADRLMRSLRERPAAGARRFDRIELAGAPGLALLVPARPEEAAPVDERPERLGRVVSDFADASRADIPPLVEDVTRALTTSLLNVTPLRGLEESPARDRLVEGGILTVGAFLSRSLESIHGDVVGRAEPRSVVELEKSSASIARDVSRAVRGVVEKLSSEHDLVAAEELVSEERVAELSDALVAEVERRRRLDIPESNVRAAVTAALGRHRPGRS